jgi:CHASE3 domain sensor protein
MRRSEEPQADAAFVQAAPGALRRGFAWLFSHRHFQFKLLSGTAAGILVIIFLAGILLYVTVRNHRQEILRAHTVEVIRLSSVIENDIAALETGHRGFLLTGDQAYVTPFTLRSDLIRHRLDDLAALILDQPTQRKRVMKVQEVVQKWLNTFALPQINSRSAKGIETPAISRDGAARNPPVALGNSLLDQARDILQSLQDEEQITLNQRMVEQEWASQSTQILDFLPKLERSVLEMEKGKRGYQLTGEASFADSYKRALTDFYTYNGYLSILVANTPSQAQLLAEIHSSVDQ